MGPAHKTVQTTSPTGTTVQLNVPVDADTTYLGCLWAWSNTCNEWLRQTNPTHVVELQQGINALAADLPGQPLRTVISPCLPIA
jgi:hypothetical protein